MPYSLPPTLSFCRLDDHLIFLDTRRDRYFRLSSTMERAFLAYLSGREDPEVNAAVLIDSKLLIPSGGAPRTLNQSIEAPMRSVIEQPRHTDPMRIAMLLDVFAIVCMMRAQLASRNLGSILESLTACRESRAPEKFEARADPQLDRLVHLSALFWRARMYVPVQPRCLVDSLSLVKVLAMRGLHANMVLGVADQPFAAHAWVQAGDMVLSDTVGHVNAYTPIRVV